MRLVVFFLACLSMHTVGFAVTPKEALQLLVDGNERYVQERLLHPNRSQESRRLVALKQAPFAIILGCSDSRASPEILFDQGIGDLFVVRVAGNVVGPIELDSIGYSALTLGSSLVLVLGHERCGAIDAVLHGNTKGIEAVADLIQPSINASKKQTGDPWENAIKANVRHVVAEIRKYPPLDNLIKLGRLEVVGGYYDMGSGKVKILTEK
ncbi:MAG: carbonic anhydrase [Chlamydiales bacterium]|nr:carbonic anhydrase [Chlamydiales bacterium]